jgi:hypothetical protein
MRYVTGYRPDGTPIYSEAEPEEPFADIESHAYPRTRCSPERHLRYVSGFWQCSRRQQ